MALQYNQDRSEIAGLRWLKGITSENFIEIQLYVFTCAR